MIMTTPAGNESLNPDFKVTITGRNVEVPEHFAERVHSKLAKIARLDPTLTFFHVELQHERNPRRADESDRIQITATGKGHIARAEAKEDSFYAALKEADKVQAAGSKYDHDPYADQVEDVLPGQVVRTKEHVANPMSVDDALSEMELVGHDFYLFINKENNQPSVVYRRHAFDYGLISIVPE